MIARIITKDGRTWIVWTRPKKRPALKVIRGREYITKIPRQTRRQETAA